MIRSFLFLVTLFLLINTTDSYAIRLQRNIDSLKYTAQIDELNEKFGQNLDCPEPYRLQMLIALSHFPELKNIFIKVIDSKIGTTASCRPNFFSLFSKKSGAKNAIDSSRNRKYVIRINTKENFKGILFKDVPFNAQIGILGHEIAHIVDFEGRGFFGVIGRAFDYCHEKSKIEFENEIDKLTISHGLGWQLYDWSDYAMYKSKATEEYKAFKRKIYMNPINIEEVIMRITLLGENRIALR